jgi:uncharacterized protein YaiI (UPF0178 family)
MRLWIDNDGCPNIVRELAFAAATRRKIAVFVVANTYSRIPNNPLFKAICVPGGFDQADDYIAKNVLAGDLVITSDVPLAAKIVASGAIGINSHGTLFDVQSIGEQVSSRNLMQELRGGGIVQGGGAPFGPKDKKRFADAFDRTFEMLVKRAST